MTQDDTTVFVFTAILSSFYLSKSRANKIAGMLEARTRLELREMTLEPGALECLRVNHVEMVSMSVSESCSVPLDTLRFAQCTFKGTPVFDTRMLSIGGETNWEGALGIIERCRGLETLYVHQFQLTEEFFSIFQRKKLSTFIIGTREELRSIMPLVLPHPTLREIGTWQYYDVKRYTDIRIAQMLVLLRSDLMVDLIRYLFTFLPFETDLVCI